MGHKSRGLSGGDSGDSYYRDSSKSNSLMCWFNHKLKKAWNFIFPLTEMIANKGTLPLTNPLWGEIPNPWWIFLLEDLFLKEERRVFWETNPQISPTPFLCKVNPLEKLIERRMLETMSISTNIMSSRNSMKLL